jgi:hypothetical protein
LCYINLAFYVKLDTQERTEKMQEYPARWTTTELAVGYAPRSHEEIEQPSDSFFKKWEAMLDWYKK